MHLSTQSLTRGENNKAGQLSEIHMLTRVFIFVFFICSTCVLQDVDWDVKTLNKQILQDIKVKLKPDVRVMIYDHI